MTKRPAWIYILHFDEPLSHARHYIGATRALRRRLERHANGQGAKITRALRKAGIEFRVALVAVCSPTALFEVEREAKDRHRGRDYCPLCKGTARLTDAQVIDTDLLQMPTCSRSLRATPTTRA